MTMAPDQTNAGSSGVLPNPYSVETGLPRGAGDRESGKFRRGGSSRATKVAVSNDDGSDVDSHLRQIAGDSLLELRAIRLGIERLLAFFTDEHVDLEELALAEHEEDV